MTGATDSSVAKPASRSARVCGSCVVGQIAIGVKVLLTLHGSPSAVSREQVLTVGALRFVQHDELHAAIGVGVDLVDCERVKTRLCGGVRRRGMRHCCRD